MVFARHPVSGAMFMIVSLVGVAALFVLLEAFFLAILQVLVYAGAVMVLFLFIIMLLDVGPDGSKVDLSKWKPGFIGVLLSVLLVAVLLFLLIGDGGTPASNTASWPTPSDARETGDFPTLEFSPEVSFFGYGLMTKYMLPLQVSGFMLLAAMVGVIIISKAPKTNKGDS